MLRILAERLAAGTLTTTQTVVIVAALLAAIYPAGVVIDRTADLLDNVWTTLAAGIAALSPRFAAAAGTITARIEDRRRQRMTRPKHGLVQGGAGLLLVPEDEAHH